MPKLDQKQMMLGGAFFVVLAIFIYFFWFRGEDVPVDDVSLNPSAEQAGQDILVLVDKLNSVSIDSSLFSGTLFTSLRDFSVPLTSESQGKPNPFAQFEVAGTGAVKAP